MAKEEKQDKESATGALPGTFDTAAERRLNKRETRFSLEENMEEEKVDKRQRRYIRIRDADMWKKIDKLMTLPKYSKSFNKIVNAALYYGLDELIRRNFETVEEYMGLEKKEFVRKIDGLNETFFWDIIRLLKEVIINETINKSLLCSLFNTWVPELSGENVSRKKFQEGRYSETPSYLSDFEIQGLRELRY